MKKILSMVLAFALVLALSVSVFAEEFIAFDNPDGDSVGVANPWEFFGSGDFWGPNTDLDMTWDEIKPLIVAGGAKYTIVYSGTPSKDPVVCFNFNTYGDPAAEINVPFTTTELGDGKYEATVALDDLVAAWTAAGMDLEHADVAALLVQPWAADFVLYSAKFTTGDDAAVETPVETPEVEDAPAVEDTPADETPADEAPAETGLALAVVPMVVAMAAVALSKKR